MPTMVFVPVSRADAVALRGGADLGVRAGCAVTPGLVAALGGDTSDEEREFAALSTAGVLALLSTDEGCRLVLAAGVDPGQVSEAAGGEGEVGVRDLRWDQVRALFADEPAAETLVAAAQTAVKGLDLGAALEVPAVVELLDGADLLWFDPAELDQL
jgi:hypothetical protein